MIVPGKSAKGYWFFFLCILGLLCIVSPVLACQKTPQIPVTIRGVVLDTNETRNTVTLQPFCNITWCEKMSTDPVYGTAPLKEVFLALQPGDRVEGTLRGSKWLTISKFSRSGNEWSTVLDVFGDPINLHAPLYGNYTITYTPFWDADHPDLPLTIDCGEMKSTLNLSVNGSAHVRLGPDAEFTILYRDYEGHFCTSDDAVLEIHAIPVSTVIHTGLSVHSNGTVLNNPGGTVANDNTVFNGGGGGLNLTNALNQESQNANPSEIGVTGTLPEYGAVPGGATIFISGGGLNVTDALNRAAEENAATPSPTPAQKASLHSIPALAAIAFAGMLGAAFRKGRT